VTPKPKRVRVFGNSDIWTGFVVEVDGKPLEVRSVALSVEADQINSVTLVLDAIDVHLDINTPAEF
jgi:hypothetical protein